MKLYLAAAAGGFERGDIGKCIKFSANWLVSYHFLSEYANRDTEKGQASVRHDITKNKISWVERTKT